MRRITHLLFWRRGTPGQMSGASRSSKPFYLRTVLAETVWAIAHTKNNYWRPLRDLLQRVDILLMSCFFTNVYVGLKAGDVASGPFSGDRDAVPLDTMKHR
jgi:hypothetical protein